MGNTDNESLNLKKRDKHEYWRVHKWIVRAAGKAERCSVNNAHVSTRYHWANISGDYKRDISDWKQLCPKCHKVYDGVPNSFRKKMREVNTGNTNAAKKVYCVDLNKSWTSAREAARELNIDYRGISYCLTGRYKTTGGYRWRLADG